MKRWRIAAAVAMSGLVASAAWAQTKGGAVMQQQVQHEPPPRMMQARRAQAPVEATLVGTIVKKPWSKTGESWDAGGGDYYVLKVRGEVLRRSAAEGVILRTSDAVSEERLQALIGAKVEIKGVFLPDTVYEPDPMEQHLTSMDGGPIMRAGGFQAQEIKVIKGAKAARKKSEEATEP